MKYCPQCENEYPAGERCPNDGTSLIDQTPRPDPLVGVVVAERYKIVQKIARGGMGTVFRATDSKQKRDVAVKVLHANLQEQADAVKRFFREAKSLAGLKHPNIVEFYDCGQMENGQLYMAMEYLYGQTLDQLVRAQGPLPLELVTSLITQICYAVSAAHAAKVVHRDLTPMNILLAKMPGAAEEVVKLVDFGIAKSADSGTQITQTGIVMGTPGYLAPEQITGESQVDPRSDVYAAGAVLYYMLAGKRPYVAPSPQATLAKQLMEPPEPLETEVLNLPNAIKPVVYRALAKKPAERYQNAEELLNAFLGAIGARAMSENEVAQQFTMTLNAYRKTSPVGNVNDFGVPLEVTRQQAIKRARRRAFARYAIAAAVLVGALVGAEWLVRGFKDVPGLAKPLPEGKKTSRTPMANSNGEMMRGITETHIYVGLSADFSATTREAGRALFTGIKTAFRAVNDDEGGVYGRQLQAVALDDKGEPGVAAKNAIELLDKRNTFALIGGLGSEQVQAMLPEAVIRNAVIFAPVSGAKQLRERPIPRHLFFYRPTYAQEARVVVDHLVAEKRQAPETIAIFYEEGLGGEDCAASVRKAIVDNGLDDEKKIVQAAYPRNTEDVSAAANNLVKNAKKLKSVVMCADSWQAAKLVDLLKQKKVKLVTAGVSTVGVAALEEEFIKQGADLLPGLIASQVVPAASSNRPFVNQFNEYLTRYYPESKHGAMTFEGYIVGRLFAMAMKIVGPEPTTDEFIKAVESMREVEFGTGLPIRFGPIDHQGSNAVWLSTWNDKLEPIPVVSDPFEVDPN
ncbi:MAG: ABC transporter substrate-binding protein [Deltaproteobacteria bacterium]|nr:ABC transporter substrate-binding protein [Deltaproteobacteria bacterium]